MGNINYIDIPRKKLARNILKILLFEFLTALFLYGIFIIWSLALTVYTVFLVKCYRHFWKLFYNIVIYYIIILLPVPFIVYLSVLSRDMLLQLFNMLRSI